MDVAPPPPDGSFTRAMHDKLPLEPLRVDDCRPPSSRRQPHRYLQESACKLAGDANRSCLWPVAPACPPGSTVAMKSAALDQPDQPRALNDADLWRNAFHAEAQECIRALQMVLDSANITHFASRFEDWRKVDLKATAQMQQHVKQLNRLNESVDEFLEKCATPDEFAKFKGAIVSMTQSVQDLTTFRNDLSSSVDKVAERTALKVVAAWEAQLGVVSDLLHQYMNDQTAAVTRQQEQQTRSEARLESLSCQVERMCEEVRRHGEQVTALATAQSTAQHETSASFTAAVDDIAATSTTCAHKLTEAVRAGASEDLAAFKAYVSDVLIGPREGTATIGASDDPQSIAQALGALEERLAKWESDALKNSTYWQETAQSREDELKEANRVVEQTKASLEQVQTEHSALESRLAELHATMGETQEALEKAQAASLSQGMRTLKEIEARGHIKVNRQAGDVKIVDPIVFLPPTPQEPNGSFADSNTAGGTLADIAEVAALFCTSLSLDVSVKVPKGGVQAQFEEQAKAWAVLTKEFLESLGVPEESLNTTGVAGPSNADAVTVQFDPAMFVSAAKSAAKKGRK